MSAADDEYGAVAPGAGGRRRPAAPPRPPEAGSPGEPERCPFVALGQRDGVYFFIAASGELRALATRELSPNGILSLTNGDARWLKERFPKLGQDGMPTNDWAPRAAAAGLMQLCADAGLWSPLTAVRGVGVWPLREADGVRLLVHSGDALWTEAGGWEPAGRMLAGALYPAHPRAARPAAEPAPAEAGLALRRHLDCWNILTPGGHGLVLGWIGCALLGAAPDWHPHLLLSGPQGAGKSTLSRLAAAVLGDQGQYTNNFSPAGFRQAISGEARGVVLDEVEAETRDVEQAIQLLRQLADGAGAQMLRGSGEGAVKRTEAAAPVWLSAVNAPALQPQDRARITEIDLMAADPNGAAEAQAAIAWAARHSAALRARAVLGWERVRANFEMVRSVLVERGASGRQGDQLGWLLAAGAMLRHDRALDADSAGLLVDQVAPVLAGMRADDAESGDAQQCLSYLLTSHVESWQGGDRMTIARLIVGGLDPTAGVDQRRRLRSYGLRLEPGGIELATGERLAGPVLCVARQHRGLGGLLERSRWANGGHARALMRLPGAVGDRDLLPVMSFDGAKSRVVAVGREWVPTGFGDDG